MSQRWVLTHMSLLLSTFAGFAVTGCGIYCILWFRPAETSFLNPDIAATCWLYCSTLDPVWGVATLVSGVLPIAAGLLMSTQVRRLGAWVAIVSGVAILPIGLLAILGGALALKGPATRD